MTRNLELFSCSLVLSLCANTTPALSATEAQSGSEEENYFDLPLESLMDIVVTSVSKREEKAFESSAAIYVITQEDIRRSGATTIPEVLRMAPGIQVSQIDSKKWAISARGFNKQFSNKLLVLIDGRSVYTPLFSGVYWDEQDTPLEDIERIEVIRGPGATLWGANAVNGVINIITKKAKDTQGTLASGGVGNHERYFGTFRYGGKLGNGTHYRAYAKHNDRDEFEKITGADGNDEWNVSRSGFRFDTAESAPNTVTIQGDIYSGEKEYPLSLPSLTSPFSSLMPGDEDFRGGNILTRWNKEFSDISQTSLQMYYDYVGRDLEILDQNRSTVDIDFQHTWDVNAKNQVIWGAGYRHIAENLEDSNFLNYEPERRVYELFTAFVQDKIAIAPEKFFLTLGSKLEHHEFTGLEIQPSIRGTWLISDKQTLWSSVSRAVRTPSRNENDLTLVATALPPGALGAGSPAALATQGGRNTELESETLYAYEAGYRFQTTKDSSVDIATFYNDYDDLRTFEIGSPFVNIAGPFPPHLSVPLVAFNRGSGKSYGIEVTGQWDVTRYWQLASSYSFLNLDLNRDVGSSDTTLTTDEGKSANNQFHIRSYLDLPYGVEWDNLLYYVDNLSTANVGSFIRFDSRIGWKATKGVDISLVGQNLFDDKHLEFTESLYSTTSEIGRSFYGKVTLNF